LPGTDLATDLAGTFFRILFAHDLPHLMAGAKTPEGRFHHDGEAAFYMSPSAADAALAVATYLRPGDPPRLIQPLTVAARVVDLRRHEVCAALGLSTEASVEWQVQRAAGLRATSWRASDAARAGGADGMIYASRKEPGRWHVVLFHWNQPGRAVISPAGMAVEFRPAAPENAAF
jgi:RES domain-containing protein